MDLLIVLVIPKVMVKHRPGLSHGYMEDFNELVADK